MSSANGAMCYTMNARERREFDACVFQDLIICLILAHLVYYFFDAVDEYCDLRQKTKGDRIEK